ncbi:MAG: thioredoxin domain-containing protein [Sphingomicrobium sp.]|nr:DsbA family protein [Sphingomonadales bacterium]
MNKLCLLFAATAILSSSACDAKKGQSAAVAPRGPVASVMAPNGDWSQVTTATPSGGFLMGNPKAKTKLVEYGSMTCPHCGHFDRVGGRPLIDQYVKSGRVSWEFRNFVRDPYDIAASLVARCNGPRSFFGLTSALYAAQRDWVGKLQAAPEQLQALQNMPPEQQFPVVARLAGFPQFAALRGVPLAKTNACLANQGEVTKLVQMNSDAVAQYNIPYTPAFLINGTLVDLGNITEDQVWPALESKLKAAINGR